MERALNLFQDESEDAILARIQEESLRYYNEVELPRRAAEVAQQKESPSSVHPGSKDPHPYCPKNCHSGYDIELPHRALEVAQEKELPSSSHQSSKQPQNSFKSSDVGSSQLTPIKTVFYKNKYEGADGFHLAAGETYVYPTNYPIRKYQKNITHSALFHNTLVSLPTGLGKTFIAAVVMYNYYRWFPQGKVVFMAPTRPLVAQQIRACHDIMAIPIKDTVEMTGSMNPVDRLQHWKSKRVFFLTPQVMANDLRSGVCPATTFKCVVIDEAHKATKEYAYCHVIKELEKAGAMFRVLALSATPGSNIKAVVEVVQNLRISTLEFREEDSPDVTPYTHSKQIEPISLSLSQSIINFREQFLMVFEHYAKSLRDSRLVTCNVQNLTKFQLLKSSDKIRSRPPRGMTKEKLGFLMSDFTVCMTLAHGLDLMQTYGLRAFYHYFTGCDDEDNRKAAFTRLRQDVEFHQLMDNIHKAISSSMDQFWSHPKHEQLVRILKDHFLEAEKQGNETKVIIFCQYRVVVSEIYELLQKIHPLIKPAMFIGQGVGKDKNGLPQKKQIEIMKQFREGKSNVLIATCVAEEGLDIGSVDLLILMEGQRSPVRLVQRLGRTGRHRKGRCVVLLTQGKEVQKFNEAMAVRKSFLTNMQNSKALLANLYKDDPSMVPPNIMPKIQLVHVNIPERITPGKTKKQSDIRQALMSKLNDNEEPMESPFLLPHQLAIIKEELNSLQVNFNALSFTKPEYLHHRVKETTMDLEELFRPTFCQQAEFNDWNRVLQQTYLLSHSSDAEMLCHLLNKAETMQLGQHPDLNTQMNYSNITANIKRLTNEHISKRKKPEKEERHGMDIRECMSLAAEKAHFTQDKFTNKEDVDIPSKKSSPVICTELQSFPNEACEVIHNNKEPDNEFNCFVCNSLCRGINVQINNSVTTNKNQVFPFSINLLLSMEKTVQNMRRTSIENINVPKLFNDASGYTIKQIITNINIKKNINVVTNNVSSEIIDIKKKLTTPTKFSPGLNLDCDIKNLEKIATRKDSPTKAVEVGFMFPNSKEEEFFNLEDIFNEDDELGDVTKISTPSSKKLSFSYTHKVDNDTPYDSKLEAMNKSKSNIPNNNFKIPQLQLNVQNFKSSCDVSNFEMINKSSSPESPILSGQVLNHKNLPLSKLGRKTLFHDTNFVIEDQNKTSDYLLAKPLNNTISKNYENEIEEENMLSASQLFLDDSSDENKQDILEQSSMYTITQMVEKVSVLAKASKSLQSNSVQNSCNNEKNYNYMTAGCSGGSSLFENISSDQLSKEKDRDKNNGVHHMITSNLKSSLKKCSSANKQLKENDVMARHNIETKYKVNFSNNYKLVPENSNNITKQSDNSFITSKWLSNTKSPLKKPVLKTSTPQSYIKELPQIQTDSDSNSDVFENPQEKKKIGKLKKSLKVTNKVNKRNLFVELEADVSGNPCSSDEENTSGLDDLDESFINDLTERPSTSVNNTVLDIHARYLQSVKSPVKKAGGFKIPALTSSVLERDVFSQDIEEEEDDFYVNDSFCCDATELPITDDPSILEVAEQILKKERKNKKRKRKRKNFSSSRSSNEDTNFNSNRELKKRKILSSESSTEDEIINSNKRVVKRKLQSSSESSPNKDLAKTKHLCKKEKRNHLLTSSDSDSDRTV